MKKKVFLNIISLVTIGVTGLVLGSVDVDAANSVIEMDVTSPIVDESIVKYAEENISFYVDGYVFQEEKRKPNRDEFALEEPFQLLTKNEDVTTTIFPITNESEIVYTFFVSELENGSVSAKITKTLVDTLNSLNEEQRSEITFFEEQGNIYSEYDGQLELAHYEPINFDEYVEVSIEELEEEKENNELEIVKFEDSKTVQPNLAIGPRSVTQNEVMTLIDWTISETQGQDNWCIAYATAMILNNKNDKRPTSVMDIVNWGEQTFGAGNRVDGYYAGDMVQYGQSRMVAPIFLNRSLTRNEVNAQILKSNGVLAIWVSNDNKRHAIDVIGLIRQPAWGGGENKGYIVWNPWYNYTELCDANNENSVLYYTPGRTWTWRETITNW